MRRHALCLLFIAVIGIGSGLVYGDQGKKVPTIGQIFGSNPSTARPYDQAFREGLRDLGYIDGKTVKIVARYANGEAARFPTLLNELITINVDVILATPTAVQEASKATKTIPIVCPARAEPVREGLVISLARPGGNVTGLSQQGWETDPKRLELAMEVVPGLRHVGLMFDARDSSEVIAATEFRSLATSMDVIVHPFGLRSSEETKVALRSIDKDRVQALFVRNSPLLLLHRQEIMGFAAKRLPVISEGRDLAEAGALLTYSPNFFEMWKRSAVYVDKILKGAKPGDLPVEQPTKFELIVNLKAAKALGITIPESILLRADEVIR